MVVMTSSRVRNWTSTTAVVAVLATFLTSDSLAGGSWAAIANSLRTGKWGYSYGQPSKDVAEKLAVKNANAPDASVAVSAHDGWIALAQSNQIKTIGVGHQASKAEAAREALARCPDVRGKKLMIVFPVETGPK